MRETSFNRASKETDITIKLNIDGTGEANISSMATVGFSFRSVTRVSRAVMDCGKRSHFPNS